MDIDTAQAHTKQFGCEIHFRIMVFMLKIKKPLSYGLKELWDHPFSTYAKFSEKPIFFKKC